MIYCLLAMDESWVDVEISSSDAASSFTLHAQWPQSHARACSQISTTFSDKTRRDRHCSTQWRN